MLKQTLLFIALFIIISPIFAQNFRIGLGDSISTVENDLPWIEDFNTRIKESLLSQYSVQSLGAVRSLNDIPENERSSYNILILPIIEEYEETDNATRRIQGRFQFQRSREGTVDYSFNVIGYNSEESSTEFNVTGNITYSEHSEYSEPALAQAIEESIWQLNILLLNFQDRIIIDRFERRVFLSLDPDLNRNILPGDEFEVFSTLGNRIILESEQTNEPSEQTTELKQSSLLRVRDVQDDLIIADVFLEDFPISIGDRIQKLERIGIGILPYITSSISLGSAINFGQIGIGSKFIWEYGLYALRPIIALEFVFPRSLLESGTGFSILTKLGLEYRITFGRFSLIPQVFWGASFGELNNGTIGVNFTEANVSLGFAYLFPTQHENIEFYSSLGYKAQSHESFALDLIHIELGIRIR